MFTRRTPKPVVDTNTAILSIEIIKRFVLSPYGGTLPTDETFLVVLSMIERGLFTPSSEESLVIEKIKSIGKKVKKVTKSEIFKMAWAMARKVSASEGISLKEAFKKSLVEAHKAAKKGLKTI